jgi:hypothetical protein
MEIENLYKSQDILLFKECYASEKIHGSSSHVSWKVDISDSLAGSKTESLTFFAGGEKHENFIKIFDQESLKEKFRLLGRESVIVWGEVYGGRCQGMSHTYGKELKFIAFEVKIGETWLSVPDAANVVESLGLEFVYYKKIPTNIIDIDAERDAPSEQAFRNGMADRNDPSTFKLREGVVLRPIIEVRKNNGERIIAKHKGEAFAERMKVPKVQKENLEVMTEAKAIADEWVTENRMAHVLDGLGNCNIEDYSEKDIPRVMKAMMEDVIKESKGEIVDSKDVRRAISTKAVSIFKDRLMEYRKSKMAS